MTQLIGDNRATERRASSLDAAPVDAALRKDTRAL